MHFRVKLFRTEKWSELIHKQVFFFKKTKTDCIVIYANILKSSLETSGKFTISGQFPKKIFFISYKNKIFVVFKCFFLSMRISLPLIMFLVLISVFSFCTLFRVVKKNYEEKKNMTLTMNRKKHWNVSCFYNKMLWMSTIFGYLLFSLLSCVGKLECYRKIIIKSKK